MANPLVQSIVRLATRLGANPQKFIGTRSNIRFLGSGPSNELFSQSIMINDLPKLFQAGGKLKPQILSKVESGVGYATAGKLSNSQLTTLNAQLKAMDNLQSGLTKPTGIVNTESFRALGRRGAKGSEFRELGQRLKAQRTTGFKEAMEAADDLIIESGGITRTELNNLSPEALQALRLEFAPDIMARFFKPKFAGGGLGEDGLAKMMSDQQSDFINNFSDQMTFEEYLQMMSMKAKAAGGGLAKILEV
jgi:hypothetical protein